MPYASFSKKQSSNGHTYLINQFITEKAIQKKCFDSSFFQKQSLNEHIESVHKGI